MTKAKVDPKEAYVYPNLETFLDKYIDEINEATVIEDLSNESDLIYSEGLEFVRITDDVSFLVGRHDELDFIADMEHYGVSYAVYKRD